MKQFFAPEQEIDRTFEIIKKYNLKTGRELTIMYNILGTLLLADVFENFIRQCLKHYKINPLYWYSAPGFTWKAFFKFSNCSVEYLKDHELFIVIRK